MIRPGVKEEDKRRFEGVVVIVIDDHNGLVSESRKYMGLRENPVAKRTVVES